MLTTKLYGSHVISWHLLGDSVHYHKEFVTKNAKNLCVFRTLSSTVKNVFYLFVQHLCSAKRLYCCKRTVLHRQVDPNFSAFTVLKSCYYWKGDNPSHLCDIMVVASGDFGFPLSCEDQTAADGLLQI